MAEDLYINPPILLLYESTNSSNIRYLNHTFPFVDNPLKNVEYRTIQREIMLNKPFATSPNFQYIDHKNLKFTITPLPPYSLSPLPHPSLSLFMKGLHTINNIESPSPTLKSLPFFHPVPTLPIDLIAVT